MKTYLTKQNIALAIVAFVAMLGAISFTFAATTNSETELSPQWEHFYHYGMVTATTTQATTTSVSIAGAKKVQAYFKYTNPTGTGFATSTFSIEVSPDGGTSWYDFNKLISNVSNTNAQMITRVDSLTASATTSATYAMDLVSDTFDEARCIVTFASTTITALDSSTCELSVEY